VNKRLEARVNKINRENNTDLRLVDEGFDDEFKLYGVESTKTRFNATDSHHIVGTFAEINTDLGYGVTECVEDCGAQGCHMATTTKPDTELTVASHAAALALYDQYMDEAFMLRSAMAAGRDLRNLREMYKAAWAKADEAWATVEHIKNELQKAGK